MNKIKTAFLATLFCYSIFLIFQNFIGPLIHDLKILDPLDNKIEDFELSDLCFAYLHEKSEPDTNIIIVNCSKDNRNGIADKIEKIQSFKPKVIGLDLKFENPINSSENLKLISAINKNKSNIVLGGIDTDTEEDRTMNLPFYMQMQDSNNGNGKYNVGLLEVENLFETKRLFVPLFELPDERIDTSFAVKITRIALGRKHLESLSFKIDKGKLINYRNVKTGHRYTFNDSIEDEPALFKNKIVLMGDFDTMLISDIHFTPLNNFVGRSFPDMKGVECQAQIISMLLIGDEVKEVYPKGIWIFLCCFLFMFIFLWINPEKFYYHFVLDIILLFFLAPLSFLVCFLFLESYSIKVEPSEFIIPVFLTGVILHLYHPFTKWILSFKIFHNKKTNHEKSRIVHKKK